MFYHFFNEYKKTVYKYGRIKLKWYEMITAGVFFLSVILWVLFSMISLRLLLIIIPFVFMILSMIAIYIIVKIRDKNQCKDLLQNIDKNDKSKRNEIMRAHYIQRYKNYNLDPLINLLNDEKYKLYTRQGVDWIIHCCKNKINGNSIKSFLNATKNFFVVTIYPLITLLIGIFIRDIDINYALVYTSAIMIMLFFVFVCVRMVEPALTEMLYWDKLKYETLCRDLEYIKTQIPSTETSTEKPRKPKMR